ncbi:filamentous hemagglutinin N-terminal domain-containing protein [Paraburkholderia sp. MMS20-SJTR3]|uniref:Filamentous hemagglutinin N-terminal domain-containing protein n=1 Tax=Paraburkholderia sejongensis TaxID=2886946 RepID=A0ABS8JRK1_9BURK|nr:filamentous hemagglutinin N-terminal domain-containing protein [Paraburkholderia sp. MMS20-SJTR3]MCC8392526.1 filamentous hemagglutinin N-terminal domain-containing protein [Paraburkholderia sp. MMS20-SJTR3]
MCSCRRRSEGADMNDTSRGPGRLRRRAEERARRKEVRRARRDGIAAREPFLRPLVPLMPLMILLVAPGASAFPVGGQVVNGSVAIGPSANNTLPITQTTGQAIVNWQAFSIGGNETVSIKQPNASAVMLNRVIGNNPSEIAGHLNATGKVFLINPAGILFAPGASVNVGSLVASTLGMSDKDFLAGNYHFVTVAGQAGGSVVNQGSIQAADGGTVAMLGARVSNSGTVSAKLGTVALGAGGDITLDFAGDGLTMLKINSPAAQALLDNSGTLAADGGQVLMSVQSADALAGTVLNQEGVVRAQSVAQRNGRIVLDGGPNGVTQVAGVLDATGGAGLTGGQIDATGQYVALPANATLDASGAAGGGRVRVGGGAGGGDLDIRNAQAIWMDPTAQMRADALQGGAGGQLIAYGAETARLYGTLSAKGGPQGGNGGAIETSGHYLDTAGAQIDASAPMGVAGTWLLDPFDVTIGLETTGGALSGGRFTPTSEGATVANGQIVAALNQGTRVIVTTQSSDPSATDAGNITVSAPITKTTGGAASLTLDASGSIIITRTANGPNPSITAEPGDGTTPGPLDIVLLANGAQTTNGSAAIRVTGVGAAAAALPVNLWTNGGNLTIGVPAVTGQISPSVALTDVNLDTRVRSAADVGDPTQRSGNLVIHGASPNGTAVSISGSILNTTTGLIDIEGTGPTLSTAAPAQGVAISSTAAVRTTIASTTGNIQIFGSGHVDPGVQITGNNIELPTTISTGSGSIDLRGVNDGLPSTTSNIDTFFPAVSLAETNLTATGTTQISVSGSTSSAASGMGFTNANVSTGTGGTIVLRASNNGTATPFSIDGTSSLLAPNGSLVLVPGSVNPVTFALIANDGTAISVFSSGAGFSIPQSLFDAVSPRIANIIVGSSTQTGSITVNAGCQPADATCAPGAATFASNLTLDNAGAGSQGIAMPVGVSVGAQTLMLSSAGAVTGGPVTANSLALNGPGSFTLTNAANQVGVLSMVGTGKVNLVSAGSLEIGGTTSSRFDSASNSVVQTFTSQETPTADVTITTTGTARSAGNIDVFSPILKNDGGDATLSLTSANSIFFAPASAKSSSGALNITLDAPLSISIGGVDSSSGDRVQIWTNGGNFIAGTRAGGTTGFDGAAVQLALADLDTRVGVTSGAAGVNSGFVTIHGVNNTPAEGNAAVSVDSATIRTSTGAIELQGQSTGPELGYGVLLTNDVPRFFGTPVASMLTSTSGNISVAGSGFGAGFDGVALFEGSSITTTGGGRIDMRGSFSGIGQGNATASGSDSYGVLLANGSIAATAANSTISVTGSTVTSDAGIGIGAVPVPPDSAIVTGPVTISTGPQGVIILRSANDGTATSLLGRSAAGSISTPGGVLIAAPASVDPSTFAVTPQNGVPITLFAPTAAGLDIDPATYTTIAPTLNTLVLGSTTQTGRITVEGTCAGNAATCAQPQRPTVLSNLTLANPATGSQGVALPFGVSMPGHTLAISSAGPVTDPNGIDAAGLLLAGNTSYTLTDPGNNVGRLAIVGAQDVTFSNPGSFDIGPLIAQTYDSATGKVTTIDGTNSSLSGSLQAESTNGGIALGIPGTPTSVNAGRTIDLVMENGEFDNAGGGKLAAGNAWHIWEASWQGETRGGLDPGGTQPNFYGCVFPGTCNWGGSVTLGSNHFVYAAQPTLTVTINSTSRLFGAANPAFTFTVTGLINGDTASGAVAAGPFSTPANANSPAGQYPVTGTFTSLVGYKLTEVPGTLTVEPIPLNNGRVFDRTGLQPLFTAQEQSFVYESNLGGIHVCVGSNQPILALQQPEGAADKLAVEWKRVRSRPNLNSCVIVNGQHGCDEF